MWQAKQTRIGLALIVFASLAALVLAPRYSPRKARERILEQDLFTMREIVNQYTLDKQRRPQSLDDLVASGYFKKLPVDPMTGRSDKWIVRCSGNRSEPGIVQIESGYGQTSNKGMSRCGQ